MALIVQAVSFTDKQGRTLPSYISNVLDRHNVVIDFRAKFGMTISDSKNISVIDNTLILSSGTWSELGLTVGTAITAPAGVETSDGTIVSSGTFGTVNVLHVEGNYIVIDATLSGGDAIYVSGELSFNINPEGFEFYVNLVPASEGGDQYSLIKPEASNKFISQMVDTLTPGGSVIAFEQLGEQWGGGILYPTIQRLADSFGDKVYRLTLPDFRNYLFLNADPFAGDDCVKFWLKASVLPTIADPSVSVSVIHTTSGGNTGFFDEVFNGGGSDYAIGSINLTIGASIVQTIDYTQATNFEIKVNGPFTASSKFGIGFFHVISPEDERYFPNATVENNAMLVSGESIPVSTSTDITGTVNSFGARIDIEDLIIIQTGTEAVITGKLVPNSQFISEIANKEEGNRTFRFAVKVEDSTLTGNYIKPVWLTVIFDQMEKFIPPLGPWLDAFGYTTYDHNEKAIPYIIGEDGLVADRLITEDDIRTEIKFKIPRPSVQQVNGRLFTGIRLAAVAQKFDGSFFELEPYFDVPFDDYPVIDNAVVIDYSSGPLGRNLPPTSDKNVVTVGRLPVLDNTNNFGIVINYSTLLRWEYWLQQLNASNEFFGEKTKDWFHYQNDEWEIALQLELVTTDGSYINYINLRHQNYDDWEGISSFEFQRLDGTALTKPLENEVCKLVAKHTLPAGDLWISELWGWIRVEPKEGAPNCMISTVLPHGEVVQNPLQPISGETMANIVISGNILKIFALFDPSKIAVQNGISFSSRVHGFRRDDEGDNGYVYNTTKESFIPVKIPSPEVKEKLLKECCVLRKVIADPLSLASEKNDITSHPISGEVVTYQLKKDGEVTVYVPVSYAIALANGWKCCTISWHDVSVSDGYGCYQLFVTVTSAGVVSTFQIDSFELFPATDSNGKWHENTIGDCRLTALYNFHDVPNALNYTDSGIVDSIRFKGVFGKYQPNTKIDNEIDSQYKKQKVVRQHDKEFLLKTSPLPSKYLRMLDYMLLHENELWCTDYNWQNVEYYREEPIILSETASLGHPDLLSRNVPLTAKFKSKLSNSISSYNNRNASKVASVIQIGGVSITGGTVQNSDGTYSEDFTGGPFILEDTTINVYVNGVLNQTVVVPSMTDITLNIN